MTQDGGAAGPPLTGLRVLDLSRVLAGPYCTMLLADLGADVVKVEQPRSGDETRGWGPPFAGGEATYFLAVNRGKRSVALDLKDPGDQAAARALAARSDVVIHNFRAGVSQRLGLGYAELAELRPGIVHCTISGFGPGRSPHGRAGYDFVVQAESGLMSITGPRPGPPSKVGVAVVDVLSGLHAAVGILAALRRRDATGAGADLEVTLLDSALAGLINVAQAALVTGEEAGRFGNAHPSIVPYEPFEAADGWIAVAAANDALWRRLCEVLERPELAADERFAANDSRVRHRDELVAVLAPAFRARPAREWLDRLDAAGVPAGKVRGVREAFQAAARAGEPATVEVAHPTAGRIPLVRSPIRGAGVAPSPAPPPLLGQHTAEVLAELDLPVPDPSQEPRP